MAGRNLIVGLVVGLILAPCLLYGGLRWIVKYFDDIDKRRFRGES